MRNRVTVLLRSPRHSRWFRARASGRPRRRPPALRHGLLPRRARPRGALPRLRPRSRCPPCPTRRPPPVPRDRDRVRPAAAPPNSHGARLRPEPAPARRGDDSAAARPGAAGTARASPAPARPGEHRRGRKAAPAAAYLRRQPRRRVPAAAKKIRAVYARVGDEIEIGLDGVGFLFLGFADRQTDSMTFKARTVKDGKTFFTFKALKLGTWALDFQQQDNATGASRIESVRVVVLEEADFAAAVQRQTPGGGRGSSGPRGRPDRVGGEARRARQGERRPSPSTSRATARATPS